VVTEIAEPSATLQFLMDGEKVRLTPVAERS